jgi:transposase
MFVRVCPYFPSRRASVSHYGFRSLRGTQVAAVFYTLCETAKLVGIDPHGYLLRTLYAAMAKSGAVSYPEELIVSTPTT